jgi:hypothetical protein
LITRALLFHRVRGENSVFPPCTMHHAPCIVHRASCIVHRASCIVHRAWCMVHGAWCIVHGAWCMVHRASCIVHRASCIVSTGGTQNSRSLLFPKIATSSLVGIHVNRQTSYGLCFPHHVSSSHPPSRASTIHEPPSKWPFSHANMRDVLPRSGVSFRSTRLSCLTNSRTVSA